MKIVIVTDAFDPQIKGVVRTINETVKHLIFNGFEIVIIEPNMFKTIKCPTYPEIPLSWNIWHIGSMIEKSKPDFLHIFTEGPLGLGAKIWADRNKVSYTTSYHTRYPEYFMDHFGTGLNFGYQAIKWFHKRSKCVMVNTQSMYDCLSRHKIKNLSIWSRGVDTDLFNPDGAVNDIFNRLERPILLNVGRISIEKNLPNFYKLKGTKIQVGNGPLYEEYKAKYRDVIFVGAKSGEELASFYRGADVFVFPSMTDTYGLVMLESISSGVPVAAYPVNGPIDVLTDEVGCMDNDLNNAVQNALCMTDKEILREWAMKKSWSTCTKDFMSYLVAV